MARKYTIEEMLVMTITELHEVIINRRAEHWDIEEACQRRIAAVK